MKPWYCHIPLEVMYSYLFTNSIAHVTLEHDYLQCNLHTFNTVGVGRIQLHVDRAGARVPGAGVGGQETQVAAGLFGTRVGYWNNKCRHSPNCYNFYINKVSFPDLELFMFVIALPSSKWVAEREVIRYISYWNVDNMHWINEEGFIYTPLSKHGNKFLLSRILLSLLFWLTFHPMSIYCYLLPAFTSGG